MTVRISDEARRAIETYCAQQGISVTAWFEAVGRRLDEVAGEGADEPLKRFADETVQLAREIDADRRSRRRR